MILKSITSSDLRCISWTWTSDHAWTLGDIHASVLLLRMSVGIRPLTRQSLRLLCCLWSASRVSAFWILSKPHHFGLLRSGSSTLPDVQPSLPGSKTRLFSGRSDEPSKFGFQQRIESIKCVVIGGLSGSLAMAPVSALNNFLLLPPANGNSLSQWEFDTDMGSLEAGLFAIVYRYCIREDDNPQLSSGCAGAFVLVRTLARVETPAYCDAIPLSCK